jgi:nitroreductase
MFDFIILPKPKFSRGKSMQESFEQRKTIREISGEKLSRQMLSNLLWAAWGINRTKGPFNIPGRTAASASNSQEIEVYVALQDGIYLYDAPNNKLVPVVSGDLRALAIGRGQENSMNDAPVQLIYTVDLNKLRNTKGYQEPGLQDSEIQKSYYFVDTGLIASNVYLFAASQGLAAWFHNCKKAELAAKLKLRPDQKVLFAQTVGYPLKK